MKDQSIFTIPESFLSLRLAGMELAPFNVLTFQVAKASPGHIPLPFLISESQRTGAKLK